MITIPNALQGLVLTNRLTKRLAVCWEIEREDGTIYRFTSHNRQLTLSDGNTYTPVGSYRLSAWQRDSDAAEHNLEAKGVITSAAITSEDLFAGLYRNASITEMLVDWQYPWAGNFYTVTYWVRSTTFNGEVWEMETVGLTVWANRSAGEVYERDCRYDLGVTRCGVTLASFTDSGLAVSSVTTAQFKFQSDASQADGYFDYGKITWLTGNNAGLSFDVKQSWNTLGEIELQLQTPFAIQVGDTFDAVAGCDKTAATCKAKFSNLVNFGGFQFIPGADRMLKTP